MDTQKREKQPTIYQANPLIESRKPFNTLEMRLFLLAIEQLNPHFSDHDKYYDEDFRELHWTPSEVKEIFGHGEYLSRLETVCQGMIEKAVTIHNKNGKFEMYPIFAYIKYEPGDGLYICFNKYMRPFLLDLYGSKTGYTKFNMKQLFNLSSAYAMRILELMLQYKGMMKNNIITRRISVEDLRFFLNVQPNEYKRMYDFRHYVLDNPIKEIKRKTLYAITYQPEKKGRKIIAFTFAMDCRHVIPDFAATETITLEAAPKKKDRHGLSEKVINKLTTICGSNEEFKKRMDYAVSLLEKRKPEKPEAFLYKAVAENYLQQELDRQAEREKEKRAQNAWNDFYKGLDEKAKYVAGRMIQIGRVAPLTVKSLFEQYSVERCRRNFEAQRKNATNASNLPGLIVFAIQKDFEGQLQAFSAAHPKPEMDENSVMIDGKVYHVVEDEPEEVDTSKISPEFRQFLPEFRKAKVDSEE